MRHSYNIPERWFLGRLLISLIPPIRIGSRDWGRKFRVLTSEESSNHGSFDPDLIPALEYVYDCLDNKLIYTVLAMKGSQVGWSELTNTTIGRVIHTLPQKMQWSFPNKTAATKYSKNKLQVFFRNTPVLRDIINKGIAKPSSDLFLFPGGWLSLATLGSISSAKTDSISYLVVEEPDDVKDNVSGQGDTLENLQGRQKTFPIGGKKLVYGGTPTDKDFSRVSKGYSESNQLVFKAHCHLCGELAELSTKNLQIDDYQDGYIDEIYQTKDPKSARYHCPVCLGEWTMEEKNANIIEGKKYGFTDFTGNFSKGWHAKRPEETEIFGFHIPELISTLPTSNFKALAQKKIKADLAYAKGQEGLLKSFVNNTDGLPYSSGISSLEAEEMKLLRKNYPEDIVPMEGLSLSAGVDVQDNRFAIIVRAWGTDDRSWLVTWKEIFGNVLNEDDEVWAELTREVVDKEFKHASGKTMKVECLSIDAADNTEIVYKWVLENLPKNPYIYATKGVRDLKNSSTPIYKEPDLLDYTTQKHARKTLAETMGVTLYRIGAHNAHKEILRRINLNKIDGAYKSVYHFNDQSYGQYEEQMTSCRHIVDTRSSNNTVIFKLVSGRRKEAMDAEKLALHANHARGIRSWSKAQWRALQDYFK